MRSHIGNILGVSRSFSRNLASISEDRTIRIWDLDSGVQSVEFSCETDKPTAVCYHPRKNLVFCGFESGLIRVFDVEEASTLFELSSRRGNQISDMKFVELNSSFLLIVLDKKCTITVLDEASNFVEISTMDLNHGSKTGGKLSTCNFANCIAVTYENGDFPTILSLPELQLVPFEQTNENSFSSSDILKRGNYDKEVLLDLQISMLANDVKIIMLTPKQLSFWQIKSAGSKLVCRKRATKTIDFAPLTSGFIDPQSSLIIVHCEQYTAKLQNALKSSKNASFRGSKSNREQYPEVFAVRYNISVDGESMKVILSKAYQLNSLLPVQRSYLYADVSKMVAIDSMGGIVIWKIDSSLFVKGDQSHISIEPTNKTLSIASPIMKSIVQDKDSISIASSTNSKELDYPYPAQEIKLETNNSSTNTSIENSHQNDQGNVFELDEDYSQTSLSYEACDPTEHINGSESNDLTPEDTQDSLVDCAFNRAPDRNIGELLNYWRLNTKHYHTQAQSNNLQSGVELLQSFRKHLGK